MSCRTCCKKFSRLLLAFCAFATFAWAEAPNLVFQIDGNPAANGTSMCNYGYIIGTVACDYWNGINQTGSSGAGRLHSSLNSFVLGTASTDSFQGGGSKDPLDLSKWAYSSTPTPNKDTLNAGYAAAYSIPLTATTSEFDIVFGADRLSPNGDANIGIWFFQEDVGLMNGGFINKNACSGTPLVCAPAHHVPGDVLIISSFTGGGGSTAISAYKWDTTCGGASKTQNFGDCFGANLRIIATVSSACGGSNECAATNGSTVTATWASYSGGTIASPLFFEGGLDVTDAFAGSTAPCFASFLEETRSSQSATAVLKDFLLGEFPVCSIGVSKACGTASLTNGTITFPVTGTVTNTGIGTLYDVKVVDAITGGSTNTISVASTLAAGASASWSDSGTSTTSTSQTDTAQAEAATASGGTDTVFSSSVSRTCSFTVTNSLAVTKNCSASLVASGGDVHVSVSYGGTITNNGQSKVTGISLTDYPGTCGVTGNTTCTSGTAGVVSNVSLDPGKSYTYPAVAGSLTYTPTEIASIPTLGRDVFEDTITISSATPQFGTLTPISGNPDNRVNGSYAYDVADCPICPAGFCPQ